MNGTLNYIITTSTPYLNSKKVGGKELILNTEITERDAQFVNRVGKVKGKPMYEANLGIEVGDWVMVHHNVFRVYYDMQGRLKHSANFIDDDLYFVDRDQIFAHKRPGGVWEALDGFSFVKPVTSTNQWDIAIEEPLKGELYFEGKGTKALGISKGDIVGFTPNSEYEFTVDGVKLYRVYTHDLNILFYGTQNRNEADYFLREEGVGAVG